MTVRFNVLDFGAKGNGIADDTHAIQLAINAAAKAGGGEVYISKGTFVISGANADGACLTLKSNVTLTGGGQGVTTLKLKNGSEANIDALVRTSITHNTENAALTNLTLDGNQAHTQGTVNGFETGAEQGSTVQVNAVTVNAVTFTHLSGNGLLASAQTTQLTVRDNLAIDNRGDGFVALLDEKGTGGFYDNEAAHNGGDGFDLQYRGSGFDLYTNLSHDNAGNGMVLVDAPSANGKPSNGGFITSATLYGNGGAGLVERGFTGYISGLDIHDNQGAGIRLEGTHLTVVTGSMLRDNGQSGDAQLVITGNTLANGEVVKADNGVSLRYNTFKGDGASTTAVLDTDTSVPQYHHVLGNILEGLPGGIDIAGKTASTSAAPNYAYGTSSSETVRGASSFNALFGGAGDDLLLGGGLRDYLEGGTGADTLTGGKSSDTFGFTRLADSTRSHMDVITDFSVTTDYLDLTQLGIDGLGDGSGDTVALSYSASSHQTYVSHTAQDGTEDFRLALQGDYRTRLTDSQFRVLHAGTAGDDTLSWLGTLDAGYITGGAGNDVLTGGRGAGHLDGGAGADTLTGGGGADLFSYHHITDSFVNDRTGVTASDLITDYSLDTGDRIDVSALGFIGLGDGHNGTLRWELVDDRMWHVESLDADADGNRFSIDWTLANRGGLPTSDTAKAFIFASTDTLPEAYYTWGNATQGKDILTLSPPYNGGDYDGLGGNDLISLGSGDSVITGGLGRDTLTGGSGADTFRYTQADDSYRGANDLITDFNVSKDLIDVSALGYASLGNGHDGTLLVAYSTDTQRTYVKDLDQNASGHRFEIALAGDLLDGMDASSFVFAPQLTLLGMHESTV